MTNLAGGGISNVGTGQNIWIPNFYLASGLAVTDVGTPVALDTSADNTVKKAADGDVIFGILQSFEDRVQEGVKTGSVHLMGGFRLTYKSGDAVAKGDYVVSAGSGEVKTTVNPTNMQVIAKNATTGTVDVLLGFMHVAKVVS